MKQLYFGLTVFSCVVTGVYLVGAIALSKAINDIYLSKGEM